MTTPTSSRRTFLRRVAAASTLGVATVGCLGRAPPVVVATASESMSLTADSDRLDERTFAGYVSRMDRRYGDGGVWGTGEAPAPTEVDFENGTRLSLRATLDGDAYAVADAAIARYGLRRFDTDGRRHVAYWLWCAARPLNDSVWLDAVGRSIGVALTSFEVGLDLDSATELLDSAPTARVSGPRAVSVAATGEGGGGATFGVDFPLRDGRLRPRVADGADEGGRDSYRIGWRGRFDGVQSVNGLCLVGESATSPDYATDWHASLSAAGWI
ncbi:MULTISPECIES: hypothetical protein [Haloprofundus]|uniref:hypothetical protein n=1 Tax=Haloprofundus TaxID=1911573 RepID=UPI000E4306FC|nr:MULTISPECIES: hypothetical protein [Haloprofundus]QCJ46852.1 hypothetical protein FCF25_06890 [Haloprofundus sp. MHR1]